MQVDTTAFAFLPFLGRIFVEELETPRIAFVERVRQVAGSRDDEELRPIECPLEAAPERVRLLEHGDDLVHGAERR